MIFEQRPNTLIKAEHLIFNNDEDIIISPSPSLFISETGQIKSNSFIFNHAEQSGEFNNVSLQFLDSHRFTTAAKLQQLNEHEQRLDDFHFTTCEPNSVAWELSSKSIHLNYDTGMGTAKHAKIYLFDVPIFYFPYFQFPIDDERHSGLLMPSVAFSSNNGDSLSIPFYWNIHSQFDSTLELNTNSKRGLQINTENRYLTETTEGSLITSSLDDKKENDKRYFYRLTQLSHLADNLNLSLLAQTVSDEDFFNDFSLISLAKTPKFLERYLSIKHTTSHWNSTLLLKNHQVLDQSQSIASRPYEQWPKISTVGQFKVFDKTSELNIEQSYVNFKKDGAVTGERFIFNPSISRKWSNSYSFIEPKISYSFSQYQLTQLDNSHEQINRSLATFSIDSGLFFERIANEEKGWLQTLEPRLFYLNTPYKDQSNIPDFDTSNLSSSYSNLFKTNRFTGGDRIGDSKQLTFGLSSRLLDLNSGLEIFRISVGQTYFQENRLVQLDGTGITEEKNSDLFLEIASQPQKHWKTSVNLTQQADTSFIKQKVFKLSYQNNANIFNLSYRLKGTEDTIELEQTDISMVYPINNQWTFFAKRQYSLIDHQNVEQLIGTSYDSCCWSFSVIALESTDDNFEEFDRSIYFQFTLKGLSNIGRDNDNLLKNSIPGYH